MGKRSGKEEIFQNIMKSYSIKEAYENWAEYREGITSYLIKYIEPGKTVALLGIGEANDIDLRSLYMHTGNLTLVDKNVDGMKNALKKYNLEDAPNIKLVQKDFVGITDEDYKEIVNICWQDLKKMKNMFSPMVTAPKVIKKMDRLYEKVNSHDVDLGIDPHEYVVAIGVVSQLNGIIEHIWQIFMQATKKTGNQIANRAMEQNNVFIPKFCRALEDVTLDRLFVGVETLEVEKESGVQGAQQAIEFFRDNVTDEEIAEEKLLIYHDVWPFTSGVTYTMAIFNRKK